MIEDSNSQNFDNVSDSALETEVEKRLEKRCENWANNMETRLKEFEKKIPRPLSAFFDALCFTLLMAGIAWVATKFNWIESVPPWNTFAILFALLFVISLVYRILLKK